MMQRSPLRDIIMDDDDRLTTCQKQVICLLDVIENKIGGFRQYEVSLHSRALEIARDRLSQILDNAEGK